MPWARQRLESAITDDILRWNRVGGISMRRLFLGTAVLQVGQVTEKMTVTADVALVETETSSRGQVVDNQRVNDLPSNGRNPFQFVGLATGVQFAGSTQTYFRP